MMADSVNYMDDYLIPGIGLRFELLGTLESSRDISVGTNTSDSKTDGLKSPMTIISTDNQNTVNKGKVLTNGLNVLQCKNYNKPELISNKSNTPSDWKNRIVGNTDSSAWSVDKVTIKSGKHRTNRVTILDNEMTMGLESQNSFPGVKCNIIPNRGRSSHFNQAPPTNHPYCVSSNSSTGRRVNGPYRLKPIAYSNTPDKDTTRCADSCRKDHNVNKQMANVSEGISTCSPARDDRWKGGEEIRGLSKQTTVLNSLRRETVGLHEPCNMEKKKMMKRQCMYFPVIDDYVTLSPTVPSTCGQTDDNISPASNMADERLCRDLTDAHGNSYEKQLSPMTISSGYESDYSPPWPLEMEKVFTKMIGTVCNNPEDSHADSFSQSETYPRSTEDQDQRSIKPTIIAPGAPNQLVGTTSDSFDRCDQFEWSRSRFDEDDRLVLSNEHHEYSSDHRSHSDRIVLERDAQNTLSKKTLENYLLSGDKRRSTGSLDHQSRKIICEKAGSTASLNVSGLTGERYRDLHNEQLIVSVKPVKTDVKRSKRYRYDVRESLCKIKALDVKSSTPLLAKQLGDFEMQSTCPNETSSRITPLDILRLFYKSAEIGELPTGSCQPVKNIISNNSPIQKKFVSNDEQVKTKLSHGHENCVGDLTIDNTKPVTRNVPNLGCAKSPKGKCDSDYEHIYDVIPGDENVLSPMKHLQPMASHLIRKKWTTLQDIRRPKSVHNENPPALPARSYLTDKGSNSVSNVSSARFVCSSVDDLYARVNKQDNNTEQLYASPNKTCPNNFDISNKENVFGSTHSRYGDADYDYVSSENYCRIGSTLEEEATKLSFGDVLNFIDGIEQPEAKRRDNIYVLLSSRHTRAKLSESLEIEHKLGNMGLLRNSWSCYITEEDEKPPKLPPRVPLNNLQPIYV